MKASKGIYNDTRLARGLTLELNWKSCKDKRSTLASVAQMTHAETKVGHKLVADDVKKGSDIKLSMLRWRDIGRTRPKSLE
jgi:hypothetical protein